MSETGKTMKVAARHISDKVEITLRKTAGNEKCNCEITANNTASALNGVCIILQEYLEFRGWKKRGWLVE